MIEKQTFRDEDGNEVSTSKLRLPLKDFACREIGASFGDIDDEIVISSESLCKYLAKAERRQKRQDVDLGIDLTAKKPTKTATKKKRRKKPTQRAHDIQPFLDSDLHPTWYGGRVEEQSAELAGGREEKHPVESAGGREEKHPVESAGGREEEHPAESAAPSITRKRKVSGEGGDQTQIRRSARIQGKLKEDDPK